MAERSALICRRVIYRGHVQGVGFRWTTARIAKLHRLAGHVKNCSDGSVEMLVQGTLGEVAALIDELAAAMSGHIESADVTEESVQAELSGFSIRQ